VGMAVSQTTDILYSVDGTIKAATFDRLIIALTDKSSSPAFRHSFLLSYRSFTSPVKLLTALEQTYLKDGEDAKAIRIRVLGVLKAWLEGHFYDFLNDTELTKLFFALIEKIHHEWKGASKQLLTVCFSFSFIKSLILLFTLIFITNNLIRLIINV
jgi:hypothetical protein